MTRTERAIASMLQTPNPVRMIGSAVWLYLMLLQAANQRGLIVRTRARLAESLSVTEELVDAFLIRLVQRDLVDIQSPSPYLVISLSGWASNETKKATNMPEFKAANAQIALEVPVSSSKLLAAAAAAEEEKNGVGVPGEGDLLAELEREFPELTRDELRHDVGSHAESTVRQALTRVRNTPPDQIRKSRIALFRYLLGKLSNPRI